MKTPKRRNGNISVRGLLVDIDGTLVDSTAVVERHWRTFASWYNLDPEGLLKEVHGRRSADVIISKASWLPVGVDEAVARYEALDSSDQTGVVALPGARRLLEAVPADRLALVTSGTAAAAMARLAAAGLPADPPRLITAESVVRGKPSPDPYEYGARLLTLRPSECLAIEDAPAGLTSAIAAGCLTLALLTTHARSDLDRATLLADDLAAIHVHRRGEHLDLTVETPDGFD